MKPYLKLETHPLANPENVIKGDKYRITVLTEHLLRLEYSEDGEFIDAASQTVVNRDFPAVEFSVKDTGDELELRTKYLQLNYNKKAFSANGLSCKQRQSASVLYRHGITEIRHRILEERPVRLIRSTEHANWNLVSCPGLVPLFWMIRSRF